MTKFYVLGSIVIGIMQTVDGALLLLNRGQIIWINLLVAFFEFFWMPLCVIMVYVFGRAKISMLSPLSFVIYNLAGWIIGALTFIPNDSPGPVIIPGWAGAAGTIFGIYYFVVNDQLNRQIKNR